MAGLVQLLGDVPWCEAVTLKTLDGGIGLGVGEGGSSHSITGWTLGSPSVTRHGNRNFISEIRGTNKRLICWLQLNLCHNA